GHLPALAAGLEEAQLLVRPARLLEGMPRVALLQERVVNGVFALFAEWVHLVEVDPRLRRNLRSIPAVLELPTAPRRGRRRGRRRPRPRGSLCSRTPEPSPERSRPEAAVLPRALPP